jgi:flagellar motor protein MotB
MTTAALFAALPMVGSGCVQQPRYNGALQAKRVTEQQLVRTEQERDTAQANLGTAQAKLVETQQNLESLEATYNALLADVQQQATTNDRLLQQVAQLQLGPLPPDLASALEDLALAYPDLLSFDAQRGMVGLASDFTFDLGSDVLKADADLTILPLADILNSEVAAAFEVRIVGHTDNVPILRAETRRKHASNLHLSVHRAIAVRNALVDAGVKPVRVEVAGAGEFRPLVPNGPKGAGENRRVEIFLSAKPLLAARKPGAMRRSPTAEIPSK